MQKKQFVHYWNAGINAVHGRKAICEYLQNENRVSFDVVLAVGKAASEMTLGALDVQPHLTGLVVTKYGHLSAELSHFPHIRCFEAGHPVPDAASLDAGEQVFNWINHLAPQAKLLVLISGGASALLEALPEEMTLQDLRDLNQWLLSNGLPISTMNYWRKRFSKLKGGRLAQRLNGRKTLALLLSDVPGDKLSDIGSGLLVAESQQNIHTPALPKKLAGCLKHVPALPSPDDSCFANIRTHIVGSNRIACQAVVRAAQAAGHRVIDNPELLQLDIGITAQTLAQKLQAMPVGVYVQGGETTVQLPDKPGRGGRNQALALHLAILLREHINISVLCAGTDGNDGVTDAAGAIIDGQTYAKAQAAGFCPEKSLAQANAYPCLQAAEALFITQPTGTNVMDLVIAIKHN